MQPKADLLDYSIAGLDPKMAIVRGRNRHKTLQSAFGALGGALGTVAILRRRARKGGSAVPGEEEGAS